MKPFRFDELASRLGERDWEIITTVRSFKYLTTRQISRQHFGLSTDEGPIPRHANHALARLRELGCLPTSSVELVEFAPDQVDTFGRSPTWPDACWVTT
jgi:hypothetical protein